ncbi:isoprenylcysteine carboxylmethyltransferase family protein [Mariprofundus sp. EBB-1]|uniref:methyltransferase family protein n=1 Tax=Mariprofundus sp. EBB-1 TaxID=2650971 RepID=UPI000EF1B1B6|nr:isoprenylcysteine carboxylmethyltransferase family protein [Mariprofundus sp. EBB-1]RLL50915.1 isoprenylcysteine carboxylmethyltransferase family protein [Mariprofundus sp. EBB-1]
MSSDHTFSQKMHTMLLRARIPASILMGLAIIVFANPTLSSWLIGLAIVVIGEALRIWASGHIHKSAQVTSTGPYAMVRHPLYLGHFLIATGFCITGDSLPAFIIVTIAFFIIYMPTWKNEEKNLTEMFGATYSDFMANTPALLPRWNRSVFSGSFSWELVSQHREWKHAAGLTAGMIGMAGLIFWDNSIALFLLSLVQGN